MGPVHESGRKGEVKIPGSAYLAAEGSNLEDDGGGSSVSMYGLDRWMQQAPRKRIWNLSGRL